MKPTKYATILMKLLKKAGIDVKEEFSDGHKHVDLAIPAAKLDIEIDGRQHVNTTSQILSDLKRSSASHDQGYETIHITNNAIYEDAGGVASAVAEASAIREEELRHKVI